MRARRYFIVAALLPFVFLIFRAISWSSAALFRRSGPTTTTKGPPDFILAGCTVAPEPKEAQRKDAMSAKASLDAIASSLLAQKDLELVSCRILQSLWAGYGHVCSIEAAGRANGSPDQPTGSRVSLILKYISPPLSANAEDEGHIRKVLSYQVEQYFYTHLALLLPESVAVAECIASIGDGKTTALVLKDLKSSNVYFKPTLPFPVSLEKRGELNSAQTYAALNWLAGFHGTFWGKLDQLPRKHLLRPPFEEALRQTRGAASTKRGASGTQFDVHGVWLNGGYTYLATRRKEYANLVHDGDSEWSRILCTQSGDGGSSLAERVATFLAPSSDSKNPGPTYEYETLIHGDVKSENMFASSTGDHVAFVDFQYVGLGLGVCDLAKLFTCSIPLSILMGNHQDVPGEGALEMQPGERKLLRHYVRKLEMISGKEYPWDLFVKHWEASLIDWLRFQASWGFWGNTEWLEARVRHIIKDISI